MKKEYYTSRLWLTEISLSDAAFINELVNTPGWIRFIGERNVNTNEDAVQYVQQIISSKQVNYWVVKLQAENIAVGIVSFIKRDYLPHHDIGFAFLPAHQQKGYAYEAASEVLKDVLKHNKHPVVLATTLKDNLGSIRLLKKLGFQFTEQIQVQNKNLLLHSVTAPKAKRC